MRIRRPSRLVLLGLLCVATVAAAQPPDLDPVPQRSGGVAPPAGWQHGAFMEIFVRAYQDSNGDGIGDLRGLTERLPYLQALGVKGLWLMPITKSADHDHGYATTDYRAIEPDYGTLADFDALIRQAHRRGIGIIIDYTINHSSAQHPFFKQALQGPANPFRDWYVWSDAAPKGWDVWGKDPWYHADGKPWLYTGPLKDLPRPPPGVRGFYYGTFGPDMPDFNLRNPAVRAYHESSLRFWLNRGLAGFRLDAVPHMIENGPKAWNDQPESRRFAKELQDLIESCPNRYLVCEATAAPEAYGGPKVCGAAFAFGDTHNFVAAALGRPDAVKRLAAYFRTAPPTMATFVSNHDIFAGRRLWDQVGGDLAEYRLAAAGYLLQPGTPFIYYGEEIGQAGVAGLPGDQPLRSPMSWTAGARGFTRAKPFRPVAPNAARYNVAAEARDPHSILAFYKAMLALRNTRPSIAEGDFEHSFADGLLLGFQRRKGGERTLVLINYGKTRARADVGELPARATLTPLFPAGLRGASADAGGRAWITLPPRSVRVFDLR